MTTVKIKIEFPEVEGNIPAHGFIEFRPTARQILDDSVVLPNAFTVELDENGEAIVELAPTTSYFVWGVREKTHAGENFYVTIPNTTLEVEYKDLVRVDPESLDPVIAIPAWEALEQRVEDLEEGIIIPEAVNALEFNTATLETADVAGKLVWNDYEGTLDLRLKDGGVTLQVGQEQVLRVVNKSGILLPEGAAVYVVGAQGQRLKVALASSATEGLSSSTIGVVTQSGGIANNAEGYITLSGLVRNINTSTFNEGDTLWLHSVAGTYDNTRPLAPEHAVRIGWVINAANNGEILVAIANPYELDELHNVKITNPQEGDTLVYRSGLWVNEQPAV